jgi:hypothetical protein
MITFVSKGCTHAVDEAISNARIRYAQERVDFHAFFPNMTTLEVRHMLRGQQCSDTRREVVLTLFEAQQASPHDLWTLLLVQACEAKLVERRLAVAKGYDAQLDQLVFDTFVDALSDILTMVRPSSVSGRSGPFTQRVLCSLKWVPSWVADCATMSYPPQLRSPPTELRGWLITAVTSFKACPDGRSVGPSSAMLENSLADGEMSLDVL